MAKTTTKSKAKTKSTKAVRSTRAKSTTKAAVKNTSASKQLSITPVLLQKASLAASVILAVLAGVMMAPVVFPLTLGYLTKDPLLSVNETVFVPAERVQLEFELKWVVVALLAFTAIYSLLLLTRWQGTYAKALNGRVFLWRWVYLAISGAVLVSLVAVLSGVYDLMAIKLIAGLTAVGYGLAWLNERQNQKTGRAVPSTFWLGLISILLPWLMIGSYTFAATVYGLVRLPWFVYATQAAVLLGTLCLFITLWLSNTRRKQWKDYTAVENCYVSTALIMQAVVAIVLLTGIAR